MSKAAVETTLTQKVLLVLGSSLLMLVLLGAGELYCRWFTRINFGGSSGDMFIGRKFGGSYSTGTIPARYRTTSGTRTSSIRCDIPNSRQLASKIFGEIERYYIELSALMSAFAVAFGGKADISYCGAYVCF